MQFYLEVTTNPIFPNDNERIAQILRTISYKLEEGNIEGTLIDINGNSIGEWIVEVEHVDPNFWKQVPLIFEKN